MRGSHEKDVYAKQMMPFAAMLADDKAINDVGIFLDQEEAQELLAYLHKLVARPELEPTAHS